MSGDKTWLKLVEDRAIAMRDGDAIFAAAEAEGRTITPAEQARLDALGTRAEEATARLFELSGSDVFSRGLDVRTAGAGPRRGRPTGPKYAEMFGADLAGNARGFTNSSDFFVQLHTGVWSPEFQAMMNTGEASQGGALIPPQFAAELLDAALEDEVVRPRARIEPMTGDSKKIAGITHRDGSAGPYGGVGGWVEEGGTISEDDFPIRTITLTAHAVKALNRQSNEAIEDAGDLDRQLNEGLRKTGSWLMDDGFLRGTGAGQPLGILNAPCTITVAAEGGQAADTVIYENLAKMFARCHSRSRRNAVWVINDSAIPQLLQLSVVIGTGGSHIPVMTRTADGFEILTRPVVFTEKASALGDAGDVMLCDFSQYAVGLRADVRIEKSAHAGFLTDTSYYRLVVRVDGQPLWDTVYTPAHGDTLSPFVVLGAR